VAVRLERTHIEFLGQGEDMVVVGFGLSDLWGIAMRGDLAEEVQGIRLVAAFLMRTGKYLHPLSAGTRVLQTAGQHIRFPQRETTERFVNDSFHRNCLFHRLCEQQHGVGDAPAQGILAATQQNKTGRSVS
jgi:hypothetical protein